MLIILQFRGELAALSAALIWAVVSLVYLNVGKQLSPLVLNLSKCLCAIGLLILTLILSRSSWPQISSLALLGLFLSGLIGIGLGDTAYFAALSRIGPRRTLLIETLAPGLSALLAGVFLQEMLSSKAYGGMLLTLGGVMWVVLERSSSNFIVNYRSTPGILWALLAALSQAIGAVISRSVLLDNDLLDPLWSTLLRLLGAVVGLTLWLLIRVKRSSSLKSNSLPSNSLQPLTNLRFLSVILATAFFSTYLGILLQQTALKYAPAGIALALSSTSPLFITPMTALLGDRITQRAIIGMAIAGLGIWLLFDR